jgi:hypothetical protein
MALIVWVGFQTSGMSLSSEGPAATGLIMQTNRMKDIAAVLNGFMIFDSSFSVVIHANRAYHQFLTG